MPVITQSDRRLLAAGGAIIAVLVVGVVLLAPDKDDDPGFPSSYSANRHGAKAAFLLLKQAGYNVERWTESPTGLPAQPRGTLLVLAQPALYPENVERAALTRYLFNGGRILAIGSSAALLLPSNGVQRLTVPQVEWKQIAPALPSRITRGGPITSPASVKWKTELPSQLVHYASDDGPLVISFRHGAGEVIWWADDTPLTNGGISRTGNLELLLNSIGDRGTRIYWDEFFHGPRQSLWSRVSDTPLSWLLAQAGLCALALLFTYSRRSGPIHPLIEESRLSPLEFVETLGALYKRARAAGFAIEVASGRFRHLLTRRLGLRRDLDPDALARAAHDRLGYDAGALAGTLRQCSAAVHDPELTDARAVELVQQLSNHSRELRLTPAPHQEKR